MYLSWNESGEAMLASEDTFDPDMLPLSGEVRMRFGRYPFRPETRINRLKPRKT